jgi:GxxExxY protein
VFDGEMLECGYRLDLPVERQVVVEVKSVAAFEKVHFAQLMTYLKFSGCTVGLLINFNVVRLTAGIRRVVRNYHSPNLRSLRPPLRPSA